MRHSRFTRTATLGLAVAAVAAPTAAARPPVDLRSPDAVDAANAAQVRQDLRSPDAVDAAAGRGTFSAPRVTVVKVTQPSQAGPGGLDWGDAGIGAGATLAIVLLGVGGSLIVVHRRHGATRRGSAAIS
jgi:hypothetical protein